MLAIIIIVTVLFAAACSFFFKSGNPVTFDQMPESIEPDCTEYADQIKLVPTSKIKSKEPKITELI